MSLIDIKTPTNFSFKHTIRSHGWYDLLPFVIDERNETLTCVFRGPNGAKPVHALIGESDGKLRVEVGVGTFDSVSLIGDVRHLV